MLRVAAKSAASAARFFSTSYAAEGSGAGAAGLSNAVKAMMNFPDPRVRAPLSTDTPGDTTTMAAGNAARARDAAVRVERTRALQEKRLVEAALPPGSRLGV